LWPLLREAGHNSQSVPKEDSVKRAKTRTPVEGSEGDGVTRLSFLKTSAGVAAGAAAVAVPAAALTAAASGEQPKAIPEPTTPNPQEPVMAYVRDAKRGEVTVVAGTGETTYRDQALVKKLLAAAPSDAASANGGIDVLAP
jgi:hypothetical protein